MQVLSLHKFVGVLITLVRTANSDPGYLPHSGATCFTDRWTVDTVSMDLYAQDYCQIYQFVDLPRNHQLQEEYLCDGRRILMTMTGLCNDTHTITLENCIEQFASINACQSSIDFTQGGEHGIDCVLYQEHIFPTPPRRSSPGTTDEVRLGAIDKNIPGVMTAGSSSAHELRSIPQNCIDKADPSCHIVQWVCAFGTGFTLLTADFDRFVLDVCDNSHGLLMEPQQWFSRTYDLGDHQVWLSIHTSGTESFLLDINLCQWYFDGVRDQCGDGIGSQGGYIWIPPSGLTFVMGIDGVYREDSIYCGGYC